MMNVNVLVVENPACEFDSLRMELYPKVNNIYIAKTVEESISVMKSKDIDIVLTDILPIDIGVEVVRYAINHNTPVIPAVVMSEYKEFIKEWDGLPYIKVLHKPTNVDILYENIKEVLKSSEMDLSENYCYTINKACDGAIKLLESLESFKS